MAAGDVTVSVESVIEQQIQEVTLDGQEICVPPLSMSENLTKLAHKIDFYKDESEEKGKPTSEGEKDIEEEKVLAPFQPSLWPWDSVRSKLKAALTEVSVLLDVLNIAKEKHHMVLDPVSQESPESKPAVQLLAKKRSLVAAASVLINGTERLRKSQQEANSRAQADFHIELLKLRQNWRLKKVGSTILGDLSYKSAGSRFWQSGTFEVVKCKEQEELLDTTITPQKSCLQVIIPSELEGVAYVKVEVKTVPEMMDITSATLKMPSGLCPVPPGAYWHQKLEVAQNVLFCKELFAQLGREAVQLKSQIPHMVVGNQIITNIFPGVQLSIMLCQCMVKDKKSPSKLDHNHVLEHSLHQLLREVHFKTINHSSPHPVTATLGLTKRRRLAGPLGYSRRDLIDVAENETLLKQIIQQTRHAVLRQRVMLTIDRLAITLPDPQISTHWSCLNSSLESSVKINITSLGYEISRSALVLEIGTDTIKAISRDGRVSILSFEEKELEDLLMWQIAFHHLGIVLFLSKLMGWQILSSSNCVGVGQMEPLGTASSVMLASPKGNRLLCVRSGAVTGQHVYIQSLPRSVDSLSSLVTDSKWTNLEGSFQEVNLDKMVGRTFVNKIEFLMAALMT